MGMYTTLKGKEIKYSGLLVKAGSPISKVNAGVVTFQRDQVFSLAVNLADEISKVQVQASNIASVIQVHKASGNLLDILDWIEEDHKELTFA